MLLEILVTAANEGSLAEIPGRWEVFISELRLNALEDCIVYYESDMMLLIQMNDIGPVNETELKLWHNSAINKAKSLLKQLLFGLEHLLSQSILEFERIVLEKFENIRESNNRKLELKCDEVKKKIEFNVEEQLRSLILPIESIKLNKFTVDILKHGLSDYILILHVFSDNQAYTEYYHKLKLNIEHQFDTFELKNKASFEKLLDDCVSISVDKLKNSLLNENLNPHPTSSVKKIIESTTAESKKVFYETSKLSCNESIYTAYESLLEVSILNHVILLIDF